MKSHSLAILGATGSIGTQTLDVVRQHPDRLRVRLLSAHRNWSLLAQQIREFHPPVAVVTDAASYASLKAEPGLQGTELLFGEDALLDAIRSTDADTVLNSLVGFSGFFPTHSALTSGKRVALANKESLVVGGALLSEWLGIGKNRILPVDSEHSAILQCLAGESERSIEKLIITASGGPFRNHSLEQLREVTVKDALNHPNWAMGAKITIDSSTLMNKGLEVIEAVWLFQLPLDKVEAVVHPQSIIHSMVQFTDGSLKAQLGVPDMKVPIQYAISYPERWELESPRMDWQAVRDLNFWPVDTQRFPCFRLAMEACRAGGYAPAVLNAANEVAVQRFLDGEIPYIRIASLVEECLEHAPRTADMALQDLAGVDHETRQRAALS
jgi:1-deoxy-D-xylulose-5-phosphate reductoisomerase